MDAKDYAKAEQTYVQALHEAEHFGPADQRVGTTLNDLGDLYRREKNMRTRTTLSGVLTRFSKKPTAPTAWKLRT